MSKAHEKGQLYFQTRLPNIPPVTMSDDDKAEFKKGYEDAKQARFKAEEQATRDLERHLWD